MRVKRSGCSLFCKLQHRKQISSVWTDGGSRNLFPRKVLCFSARSDRQAAASSFTASVNTHTVHAQHFLYAFQNKTHWRWGEATPWRWRVQSLCITKEDEKQLYCTKKEHRHNRWVSPKPALRNDLKVCRPSHPLLF